MQDSHQPLVSFERLLSPKKESEVMGSTSQLSPISCLLHPPSSLSVEPNIQALFLSHFSFALISAAHLINPASLSLTEFLHSLPRSTHFYKLALHVANSVGGAQFYMSCYQLNVGGNGNGNPSPTIKLPGGYSPTEPGILFTLWTSPKSYVSE